MVGEDQSILLCRKIEDATLAGGGLLGKYVENWEPFRMLQVKGVEHRVGHVQQLLTPTRLLAQALSQNSRRIMRRT